MRYIICPKHSFHVTQPSLLSIEPDFRFPFYMASHVLRTREWTLGADTSYIQHLSTRRREISNSHQFERWYCQWQQDQEQDQTRVFPLPTNWICKLNKNCWKCDLVQGTNTIIFYHLHWSKTYPTSPIKLLVF